MTPQRPAAVGWGLITVSLIGLFVSGMLIFANHGDAEPSLAATIGLPACAVTFLTGLGLVWVRSDSTRR